MTTGRDKLVESISFPGGGEEEHSKHHTGSLFMIGANGNVRGKKEFEPSSQAAESKPLLARYGSEERVVSARTRAPTREKGNGGNASPQIRHSDQFPLLY